MEKDFKVAIIKRNYEHKTNEKQNLSKENRTCKEDTIEILELKNKIRK